MDGERMIPALREHQLTTEECKQIHGNWSRLIPNLYGVEKAFYESGRQCLCCEWYVQFEWPLGTDWGGCSNYNSEWNAKVVFEHHTCAMHKYTK